MTSGPPERSEGRRDHRRILPAMPAILPSLFVVILWMGVSPTRVEAQATNTCLACHAQLDPPLRVTSDEFLESIHGRKGLTCASCHGGDPTKDDPSEAMNRAAGFRGNIERKEIPAFCAKCHSDAAYMRSFNPSLRTDQYSQYQTSVHGKRQAKGDLKVAVCVDCHGAHDIQPPNDPRSKVYPVNVAATCARCHADAQYMKGYGIPTDQFASYSASVHHDALAVRGDLSAPTCSTCHGSHGAAPPGVGSVARVCSTCHVFQAQIFDSGPHKDAFDSLGLPGCVTCHSNHRVQHPTDAMIGANKEGVCVTCHSEGDAGFEAAGKIHEELVSLDRAITRSDDLLGRAERSGIEVGEAKLAQVEARDDLTKARVEIHSVELAGVDPDVQAGLTVTEKTWQAGHAAMRELSYRRKGLLVSLATIVIVLIGLFWMIRKLEPHSEK